MFNGKIIINHNRKHFKKTCSSKTCNHFTHQLLPNDSIREQIFSGILDENDCEGEDVRAFLNFLQDKDHNRRTRYNPLVELEWKQIV